MALKFISDQMSALEIPYEFEEWTSDIVYPYFVGEYVEEPIVTEDGAENATLILTGFHKGGKYIDLEAVKNKLKKHFHPVHGYRSRTDSGASIAVFYENADYIPTGEADLKKIQINFKIKQWKGEF